MDKKRLIELLRDLAAGGNRVFDEYPEESFEGYGLCRMVNVLAGDRWQVRDVIDDQLREWFRQWPEWSGCDSSPVPHPDFPRGHGLAVDQAEVVYDMAFFTYEELYRPEKLKLETDLEMSCIRNAKRKC